MATPYISEIRLFSFSFAPRGWAFCNGQTLPINQNQALFSLLGTTYGGDGITNFKLPNLQGQLPINTGSAPSGTNYPLGETGGVLGVTLTAGQIPSHNHILPASTAAALSNNPATHGLATPKLNPRLQDLYGTSAGTSLAAQAIAPSGGGQAHSNLQPVLVLNYCIALQGIFPSRN